MDEVVEEVTNYKKSSEKFKEFQRAKKAQQNKPSEEHFSEKAFVIRLRGLEKEHSVCFSFARYR